MQWFHRSVLQLEKFAVKRAIARVIDTETYYAQSGNPAVSAFERALSLRLNNFSVVGLNSGTDALVSALRVIGIGHGDEVIVPAFSFISTASAVGLVGATPVFVDVREEDFAIDSSKIEEKITTKTKAVIVAHLFGQPALRMADILPLAQQHGLFVIEDAAHAFGSTLKINGEEKPIGTIGDFGCFSFSSSKILSAPGNGGALVMKNSAFTEDVKRMRAYGAKRHYFDYPLLGGNSYMHEIQAAALIAKLDFFDHWLSHRKKNAAAYSSQLSRIAGIILQNEYPESMRTWYRYVIRVKERDALFERLMLRARSNWHLMPSINYPIALPYFSVFQHLGHVHGNFPIAEKLSSEVLSLPITNYVSPDDASGVAQEIEKFFGKDNE
ncbi:MAG: DegT/DnrJ/EryC1/StrS family aminotransferase [bacterium]|nr:DegT/DnrJ/EryC1/StrS family aminotransferase [bacterium]